VGPDFPDFLYIVFWSGEFVDAIVSFIVTMFCNIAIERGLMAALNFLQIFMLLLLFLIEKLGDPLGKLLRQAYVVTENDVYGAFQNPRGNGRIHAF
jgi:hypothetical protein